MRRFSFTTCATATSLVCLVLMLSACGETVTTVTALTGTIVIDSEPNALAAGWQVSGPNSYGLSGSGDQTLSGMRIGDYTVTWLDVAGYTTPAPVTLAVAADSTATFTGTYLVPGLPFPDTADKLMANFRTAYETRDLVEFKRLLHPDHITILQASTVAQFPDVGLTLDVIEERRIHERMFSGLNVTDPIGALVPGVQGITFQTFARQGTWGTSPGTDQIPDTQVALYDMVVLWDRGGLYSTLKVQGSVKFYVVHQDSLVDGVTKPYYRLRGQLDLTGDFKDGGGKRQGDETNAWGSVKALFR